MSYMGVVRLDQTVRDVMESVIVCPRQGRGSTCFVCLLFDACYWVFLWALRTTHNSFPHALNPMS